MERFLNYSSIDFVYDDDFVNWVNHGKHLVLTDERWRKWISMHPHKAEEIEEARVLVLTLAQQTPVVGSRVLRDQLWNRIQCTLRDNDEPVEQPPLISRWYSKVAVFIGLVAAASFFLLRKPAQETLHSLAEIETASSNTILVRTTRVSQTLVLGDGTSVVLMPGSILEYPRDLNPMQREVYLSGEAYFEISDESNQPFVIKTSELTLASLGSSFNVRGYENEDDTRIQVKSGRASVTRNDQLSTGSVVLMANHQATFRHSDKSMVHSLADDPGILVPVAQASFSFHDIPVARVFESIESAYGIEIDYDEHGFSNCILDADLNALPLYAKLKTICDKLMCTYEVIDARIVMRGGHCGPGFGGTAKVN